MSIYAKINSENIVENVIVCEDSVIYTQSGLHIKITELTNEAKNGYEYVFEKNKFKAPQTFDSWTLNEETLIWEAPKEKPTDGFYRWDEDTQDWVKVS